jgi:pimeloyl-ACP methyl ester carboxylesterase
MTTVERHLLETRYGRMHVRTSGSGAATPLLLLHSQFVAGQIFDAAIPVFAASRPVVVPDRINHGDSDHWPETLNFTQYAHATLDALDRLGVGRFDAYGFHSACCEEIELATGAPDRLRRAAFSGLWNWEAAEREAIRAHYVKPPPEPVPDGSHLAFYWQWWLDAKPADVDLSWVQANVVEHMKAGREYWRTFEAAVDYPMAERIPQITQPMLVLAAHDHGGDPMPPVTPLLPEGTEVVDLPHIDNAYGLMRTHLAEISGLVSAFLDAPG